MTFFSKVLLASAALISISACGGASDSTTTSSENTVEKPADNTETSTPQPASTDVGADAFAALPAPYVDADYARGRRTYKLCQSCHTLPDGGQNLVGPNLYGVFGREVGAVEGFTYSTAVADAEFVWTPEKLDEWLTSPRNFLPGNKMSFAGVRKPEDRLAVIAYIMSETGYVAE